MARVRAKETYMADVIAACFRVYYKLVKAYSAIVLPILAMFTLVAPLVIGSLSGMKFNIPIGNVTIEFSGQLVNETDILNSFALITFTYNSTIGKIEKWTINIPTIFSGWVGTVLLLLPFIINIAAILIILGIFAVKRVSRARVKKVLEELDDLAQFFDDTLTGWLRPIKEAFRGNVVLVIFAIIAMSIFGGTIAGFIASLYPSVLKFYGFVTVAPIAIITLITGLKQIKVVGHIIKVLM